MGYKHPEPAQSRKPGLHLTNPQYNATRKRKVWTNCARGMLFYIIYINHILYNYNLMFFKELQISQKH